MRRRQYGNPELPEVALRWMFPYSYWTTVWYDRRALELLRRNLRFSSGPPMVQRRDRMPPFLGSVRGFAARTI